MQNKTYVPLHSHYDDGSLLDGLGSISEYVEKAKEYGMPGLCKTDHGRIGLFLDFYKKCKENGINPIIGCEFYISHGKYDDKTPENKDRWHLTCFAKNNEGLKNIFHLSYEMNKNGFYYKPRIDDELLFKYKEGIICLSGCASSEICSHLRTDEGYEYNYDKALEVAKRFKKEFGDDYYIELQDHVLRSTGRQWEVQDKLNKDLTKIATQLGIKRVLAADNHYCNSDDEETHEVLLCIGTGKRLSDTDRMSLSEFDLSLKSPEVLYERWKDDEEVLTNTLEVNNKVHLDFNLEQQIPPIFKCPDGMSEPQYLKYLTYRGAVKRYVRKNEIPETISECADLLEERVVARLEKELAVINKLELNSYILIVQEYINWAKNNGIRVGPGRGCFVPGQLVGNKRIENIKVGSKVRTFNGQMQTVTNKFVYDVDEEMIRLCLSNGKTLELTKDHKVMTKNDYFVEAQNLKIGDILLGNKSKHDKIKTYCSDCKKELIISVGKMIENLNEEKTCHNKGECLCLRCFNKRYREKVGIKTIQERMTTRLKDEDVRKKISSGVLNQMNENGLREKIKLGLKNKREFDKESYNVWRENIGKGSRRKWKDLEYREKCEKTRDRNYKCGRFYSERQNKEIYFDSSYEEMFLQKLELDANVEFFDRCKDIIEYEFDGIHSYKPDFEVLYKNGDKKVFEVKGFWTEKVEAKKNAAIEFYKDKKTYYQILYLEDIQKYNDYIHNDIIIEKIETFNYKGKVYDLEVEDNHNYNVNGVCVHNSSMGSLVCYCTNITALDPIDDDSLMFERFINADRISMADIDSDFEAAKRPQVIQHLRDLYGEENVAAIGVFGTMRSKNAFRDVARVLDYPFADSLKVTKLIPDAEHTGRPKLNEYIMSDEELKHYLNDENASCEAPEFRELYHSDPQVKRITDIAVKLEGRYRTHGIHACATVVAPTPIWNFFPVETSNDIIATTVPMHDVEEGGPSGGLWKIDVLGLSTLDLIEDTLRIIKSTGKQVPDIDNIPLDDYETLKLYREGRSKNTFTFSSPGMRHALMGLKVDKFSDLTLVNALYRPGAMDYIDNIIRRKFGQEEIKYMLNDTEHILKDTYGYVAYQEQGIRIALQIGFSGGEADNMRKALAKKNKGFLDMIYPTFKEKAMACGNTEKQVEEYWESLIGFSRYSFNYAHALAYAFLGYQTGYLKAHYPAEYMAAYLNHVSGDKDKLGAAIVDAKSEGIEVSTPNVLYSDTGFAVDNKGKIVYALSAIKKVGKASDVIIENRKHNIKPKTLGEFLNQFTSSELTRGKFEALAKGGAFDCFADNEEEIFNSRAELLYNFDKVMDYYKPPKQKKNKKQVELFDMDKPDSVKPVLDRPARNYKVQTLFEECEYIGHFISDSPLDYIDCEESENWWTEDECLKSKENKTMFTIPIIIMTVKKRYTKTGKKFAKCECLTNHGQIEITMWSDQLEKCEDYLGEKIPAILYAIPDMYNEAYKQMKYVCKDIEIADYKEAKKDL